MSFSISRAFFELFTPFLILINTFFVVYFQEKKSKSFYFYCNIVAFFGWLVEWVGVETQQLFGSYHYGETLGWKPYGVPVVMAFNWLFITLMIGNFTNRFKLNWFLKSLIGASLLTLLDFLIEPVAIKHDYWQWQRNIVPLQNYFIWMVVSWGFLVLFFRLPFSKKNVFNDSLLITQVLFFLAHNILYILH